jgi:glycosyltransferase involved in cell wall biosynthesis
MQIKIEMTIGRKKIMHLVASNFYGGPEKQIVEHLKRLNDSCYRGMLASFVEWRRHNETLDKARNAGLPQHGIPMSGPLDFRAWGRLGDLLKKTEVNLLCTHGYKSTVMGYWEGKRARIPVLAFSRGYTAENKKVAFYEWLERRVLEHADGIIFVSEGQKRRLESFGIKGKRSWVVHNAATIKKPTDEQRNNLREVVRERLGIPKDAKMVVSAGRLSPEKGHRFMVEAIGRLRERTNNTSFIFCGDGICQKDLEKQAKKLGISDVCCFLGFREDLNDIFQAMDVMVLPSLTEGLPNVLLETFACAKPVVATSVGGVPEVVVDGLNGLLVPAGRPDLLADAMQWCLTNPEMMRAMGEAGYQKVRSEFSFEEQTKKLENIYSEILNARGDLAV